jgi:hypothetical protein
LYWQGDVAPDIYGLAVGAFVKFDLSPTFSVWEESMHSWMNVPDVQHHPKAATVPG